MRYGRYDIQRHVSQNAFRAGEIYRSQGRVLQCGVADGAVIARVQGNERKPYQQIIHITKAARGQPDISGSCTCPVGFNCKHVAAALLQALHISAEPIQRESPAQAAERRLGVVLAKPRTDIAPPPSDTLPYEISAWLDTLAKAQTPRSEDYPPDAKQRIVYVLMPDMLHRNLPALTVSVQSVRVGKDGNWLKGSSNINWRNWRTEAPKYYRPADLDILERIASAQYSSTSAHLTGSRGAEALDRILATGRARWREPHGPTLAAGPPRPGRVAWRLGNDAALRPYIETGPGVEALAAAQPVYVDAKEGLIGPLEIGLEPNVANALLEAPPVPVRLAERLGKAMAERAPALAAARPVEDKPPRIVTSPPTPRLHLMRAQLPVQDPRFRNHLYDYAPKEPVGLAHLAFDYEGVTIASGESRLQFIAVEDGGIVEVRRDTKAEAAIAAALLERDFVPVSEQRFGVPAKYAHHLVPDGDELAWYDAMYRDIPELGALGWRIDIDDDFPFRVVFAGGEVAAEIKEGSGIDWLELDLGVVVDGERIDLVPAILALIAGGGHEIALAGSGPGEPFYLPLADGRLLALPAERLIPIVQALYELAAGGADGGSGKLRLSPADAAGLAEFEAATAEAGLIWRGGERIRAMGSKLRAAGGIPEVTLPDAFRGELRPYQQRGVDWLHFLRDAGLGGILADDMGLGKTVQALALIAIEKAEGRLDLPVLVIAPTSLMANWRREAERFTPHLKVLTLQGLTRKERFGDIPNSDIVLSTYPLLARDHAVLGAQPWHIVILDEAQTVKNPEAATTKLLGTLEARHRFCLTGTPLENHLGELWSLFSFASPGFLGDRRSFATAYRTPIEKKGDHERGRLLAKRIKPFLLRRAKSEVANDLPPKTEIAERIEFGDAQRDVYETIRLAMHERVRNAIAEKGFARSRIVILDALLKLRQACCDPRLLKLKTGSAAKAGSAKLERLNEMLEELVAEGRRILVFSQFTSMLDLIRPELDKASIPYALLTGDTRDREPVIRGFQDGKMPVFLISLKAGGVGLNLTAADTVVIYDPWWNPAVEEQAIDRAHRIGQDKPVFIHRMVAQGTIEEKMEILKEKKRHLAQSIFDHDGAPTLAMTEEDLDLLLSAA